MTVCELVHVRLPFLTGASGESMLFLRQVWQMVFEDGLSILVRGKE